jgi:hypothetical protein
MDINLDEKDLNLEMPTSSEEERLYAQWERYRQMEHFFYPDDENVRNVHSFVYLLEQRDIYVFYAQLLEKFPKCSDIIHERIRQIDQKLDAFYQQHSNKVHQLFLEHLSSAQLNLVRRRVLGRMLRFLIRYHKVGLDQLSTKIPIRFPDIRKQIDAMIDQPVPIKILTYHYMDAIAITEAFQRRNVSEWEKHTNKDMLRLVQLQLDSTSVSELVTGLEYVQRRLFMVNLEKKYEVAHRQRGFVEADLDFEIQTLKRFIEEIKTRLYAYGPFVHDIMDHMGKRRDPSETKYDRVLANPVQDILGLPAIPYVGLALSDEQIRQRRTQERQNRLKPKSRPRGLTRRTSLP